MTEGSSGRGRKWLVQFRHRAVDSPLSVTEWARMIVLFAVDHPSGFKNLFKLGQARSAERTVALAHRLQLGLSRRALIYKMEKYGLKPPPSRDDGTPK